MNVNLASLLDYDRVAIMTGKAEKAGNGIFFPTFIWESWKAYPFHPPPTPHNLHNFMIFIILNTFKCMILKRHSPSMVSLAEKAGKPFQNYSICVPKGWNWIPFFIGFGWILLLYLCGHRDAMPSLIRVYFTFFYTMPTVKHRF